MDVAGEKRRIRAEKARGKAQLRATGLVPGGQVGDQALADEATSDGDGDGVSGEGEAPPKPGEDRPGEPKPEA